MKHRWLVCLARDVQAFINKDVTEIVKVQGGIDEPALVRITANTFRETTAGSLFFFSDRESTFDIVQVIAPGQWTSVTPAHLEG